MERGVNRSLRCPVLSCPVLSYWLRHALVRCGYTAHLLMEARNCHELTAVGQDRDALERIGGADWR